MRATERREILLRIMDEVYAKAKSQAEFTAAIIAEKAEVTTVYVYRLIGPKFKELRAELNGPRRSPNTEINKLRRENKKLRREVRDLKAERRTTVIDDLSEAMNIMECQDEENRMLRARIKMLEERLKEKEIIVIPA